MAEGSAGSLYRFRNVYRMLSTVRNDLEAAKLWQQLNAMKVRIGEKG